MQDWERNEMPHMSLQEIADACGGTYIGSDADWKTVITGVVRDNRDVQPGNLFVAIEGERVDGHSFVADAFARGAACALVQKLPKQTGNTETGKHSASLRKENSSRSRQKSLQVADSDAQESMRVVEIGAQESLHAAETDAQKAKKHISGTYILVKSTLDAMKKLAAYYRSVLDIRVVGITGSVGKTSTKEMIASVLSQKYCVLKTDGNYNNEIGLPLTIFRIRKEHQVAVLEMGISDFGEMHRLAAMAQPDIAVITNIGYCHLENLGTREGILNAKTEMFDHMREGGVAILNGDDDKLVTKQIVNGHSAIFYGIGSSIQVNDSKEIFVADEAGELSAVDEAGDYSAVDEAKGFSVSDEAREFSVANEASQPRIGNRSQSIKCGNSGAKCQKTANKQVYATDVEDLGFEGMQAQFHTSQGDFPVRIPIPGEHNVYNALAATAVGLELGLTLEEIAAGIVEAETIAGRMHFIHSNGMTIIDDCYNANPVSMKAGLSLLAKAKGRSIAVLGDMGELGEDERRLHREVGVFAGQQGIHTVFAAGQLAQEYIRGIRETNPECEVHYYSDRDSMTAALLAYVQQGDSILVKASHFMEFPKVVAALRG